MKNIKTASAACVFALSSVTTFAAEDVLVAHKLSALIQVDGAMDAVWSKAKPIEIKLDELPYKPNNGYTGIKSTTSTLRAMHDGESLYLLVQWDDPTESLERFPWQKQADGSWKQLMNKDSTGHDNTYYEDKFAFFWDINARGFKKKGCDIACHMPDDDGLIEGVKDTSAGRHFTKRDNETIDMWHWKSARSNPVDQMDDQFVNSDRQQSKSWGRHPDDKTAGSYSKNKNEAGTAPAWMNSIAANGPRYWVLDDQKQAFEDTFKAGDVIGGVVAKAAEGSRGDLTAKGVWKEGRWTLEIKRKLVTEHPNSQIQDVQFSDLSKAYPFGVTAFDNAQINHLYHTKSYQLVFEN